MYIKIRAKTEAKTDSLEKISSDTFAVSVKAPAKQNLANKRIIELVAEHYSLPKNKIRIINGHHSPSKILSVNLGD